MDNAIGLGCRLRLRGARAARICILLSFWAGLSSGAYAEYNAAESDNHNDQLAPLRVIKFVQYGLERANENGSIETAMLRDFAATIDRKIQWVEVFRSAEALAKLNNGEADISLSPLPVDPLSRKNILASEPVGLRSYRVVGPSKFAVDSPLDLGGLKLAVKLSSPMWPYLERLTTVVDNLSLQVLPDDLTHDQTLRMLASGHYDAALVATEMGDKTVASHTGLKYLFDLTGSEPLSWTVPKSNAKLMKALNQFIRRFHTAYHTPNPATRTFEDIRKHGVLRVITRIDETNYFLIRGRPAGFELGFARRFAEDFGLRLDVLVGRSDEEILGWLHSGAGDIVTSRINSHKVRQDPSYSMSREYRHNASVMITATTRPIRDAQQLLGKKIGAYEHTSDFSALESFVGNKADAIRVSERVSMADLLQRVETGVLDGVVVDARHVETILETHSSLVAGMSIANPYQYRWTFRGADAPLISAVDNFIYNEYRDETYNVLERRYARAGHAKLLANDRISPFDDLLRTYAKRYEFDWRLIAAQMYQESQFDPGAISDAGAIGLMQLMPATAQALGVARPQDPETAIDAGMRYLDRLRNRFDDRIPTNEKTWLALAAYNIGYDRVRRARKLAAELGHNPNKWFGNVEVAMREMTRAFSRTRAGCRCGQAIVYVRSIRSLYSAYRQLRLVEKARPMELEGEQPITLLESAELEHAS